MGIFNKTESELKREEEIKKLDSLSNMIAYSKELNDEVGRVLLKYISQVRNNKRNNDFYDVDFLYRVFIQLIDEHFNDVFNMKEQLKYIIDTVHFLLPAGIKSDNYEYIKEMVINNFVSFGGFINNQIFDKSFYSLFIDKNVYLSVMNIINKDSLLRDNINMINDYAVRVSKYCINSDIFYNDIISYINGLSVIINYNEAYKYTEKSLDEARKRIGVYSIDEADIALCNSNLEEIENYMDQFKIYTESLDREKKAINTIINNGKKRIKKQSNDTILELRKLIEEEKNLLRKSLDDYLLELESNLKENSDNVFREILDNYGKQVREFRNTFSAYSKASAMDLIRIQKATEESIEKLKEYVDTDPGLQELLNRADKSNLVRDKIIQLVDKEVELSKVVGFDNSNESGVVMIPGSDRIVVPATSAVIIPDSDIKTSVLDVFDENIDFNLRLEKILEKKELNESRGKIYHEKTIEIIKCIMEGDWPYLWGPSGCGKSYLMKQVSDLIGIELVKSGKITEPYTVIGYNDPQGRFRATQTYVALKYGKLLALDELDNGNPDTQVILNEIYSTLLDKLDDLTSKQYVTFAEDVPVLVNPNFRMISAGNTSGEGENSVFSSRGKMDESVQERMVPKFINYDNRVEERIFGDNTEWYDFFIRFREACDKYALSNGLDVAPGIGTTRDASAICKYIRHNSKSLEQVLDEKFIQTKNSEYREALAKYMEKYYNFNYDGKDFKVNDSLGEVDSKTIARKFVYRCKKGIR